MASSLLKRVLKGDSFSSGFSGSAPELTSIRFRNAEIGSPEKHRPVDTVDGDKSDESKPKYIEPMDYETVSAKNRTILHNDPQREMLNFPYDDVSQSTMPRRFRTSVSSVPPSALREATSLLVKECIKSYTSAWNVIHYKYSAYSGTYLQLPKLQSPEALPEQVFEVDAENEGKDEESALKSRNQHITKKGWLYKGPDSAQESSIISFTKSFKRRYFYLKQQTDGTYLMEWHKDDKKLESKGSIFLDSAIDVCKSTKRGKNAFEVRMHDKRINLLAAESEAELNDWVSTLQQVISCNESSLKDQDKRKAAESPAKGQNFQESLEHSMNPELQKYARETDSQLTSSRKQSRQKLFAIYPDIQRSLPSDLHEEPASEEVYKEQFGKRFIVSCEEFTLRLQANLSEDGQTEQLKNPEPFFISISLYDAKKGEKISEDFNFDPNSAEITDMLPSDSVIGAQANGAKVKKASPDLHGINPSWLAHPKLGVFSVVDPHPEIYLVARIEKVLQGSVTASTEPYTRTPDVRNGTKLHRLMRTYCTKLGGYRMPFAWAARPLFKPYSGELETHRDFALYRADASKVSEEELIHMLVDMKNRVDSRAKPSPILGTLKVCLHAFKAMPNTLTNSLLPVKPFQDPPPKAPVLEVEEFLPVDGRLSYPFTTYSNHMYIYPKKLRFDSQKAFPKARNIACTVEVRDNDADGSSPLKLIYNLAGGSVYTTSMTTSVLHHSSTPDYVDEVKIALPAQVHEKHHLVFKFYHISCDLSKTMSNKAAAKRVHATEVPVGYAWFPLLSGRKVIVGEQNVRVASNMPTGYLSCDSLSLGRTGINSDARWVDAKPLFKFTARLASTVYTKDQHLNNFFTHCQHLKESPSPAVDSETSNKIKSLHAVEISTVIHFLPTLFNQLFRLLPRATNEDVSMNTVRALIHMVTELQEVDKLDILQSYVKYVFMTEPSVTPRDKTVHEELSNNLNALMRPQKADPLVIKKLLNNAWFFFEIIVKSMAQHLLSSGRIKMARNERFPSSFQYRIMTLVQNIVTQITQKYRENLNEAKNANTSLANFIKKCFTFMDRGYVFRMINSYIEKFSPGDPKILHEYKFEFLRLVCTHEHYVPLNMPLMRKHVKNYKESKDGRSLFEWTFEYLKHDYTLSDEFRKTHFLVGLLIHELKLALNEIRDIRKFAIITLRNLLAKHSFDDRYSNKAQQARIASLYLPFITIVLENKNRLLPKDSSLQTTPTMPNGDSVSQLQGDSLSRQYNSSLSIDTIASTSTLGSVSHSQTLQTGKMVRDPAVFAMIAGSAAPSGSAANVASGESKLTTHGSQTSLSSTASSGVSNVTEKGERGHEVKERSGGHARSVSMVGGGAANSSAANFVVRYDKLDSNEVKDLLICFTYIVKNLSEEVLLGWFNNSTESDVLDFFHILEVCMENFKYLGRKRITSLCIISDSSRKAVTLPGNKKGPGLLNYGGRSNSGYGEAQFEAHSASPSGAEGMYRAMMEANLSSEVAMIVLDVVSLYTLHFKEQLMFQDGGNMTMEKIFDLHLHFLQTSQSESVQKHAFAALRSFIGKFPRVLFCGDASMCGRLCYEILRCCNSRLPSSRSEACTLMYLVMRSNFEFCKRKSFTRVHLQMIIAVSQLITDVVGLNNSRFTDSLSVINSYAHFDKVMQPTSFPHEVKDLTRRIRNVLMATAQMKEHENDPEKYIDLQYCLAKSYTSTPELRKTWLHNMAKVHRQKTNYSEAAHCFIHIAALVAEYLKRRGEFPQGCSAFKNISSNVEAEEAGMKDDAGMQDVAYTEDHLTDLLEECAELFELAERYEVLGDIYRLIIPIYERKRDFDRLAGAYEMLHQAYSKIVAVMRSGKRLLGTYFRVAFFGQSYFEDEDGKEYIYKEPKVTSLTEICDRLKNMYAQKYGKDNIRLIMDSNKVNPQDLDPKFAYIQVTYAVPYFDVQELDERQTDFERNNNIRRFMYETPFTKDGQARGNIEDQYKRRTILTTSHSFPYVTKRILVVYHNEKILTPIEVAVDEMENKVNGLTEVVDQVLPDVKRLHLILSGCVSAQVNAGPMAYAETFLVDGKGKSINKDKVNELKELFRDFVDICGRALDLSNRLKSSDQAEYQESMYQNYRLIGDRLSEIFGEQLLEEEDRMSLCSHRSSVTVFSAISSTSNV